MGILFPTKNKLRFFRPLPVSDHRRRKLISFLKSTTKETLELTRICETKKFDHFRSGRPQVKMDLIFEISDPQNPPKRPETEFGHRLKIDPETLKVGKYANKTMVALF